MSDFLTFWLQVPRKRSKKAAERAYTRARKLASADEILLRLALYKSTEWAKRDLKWIPYPATWLNGEDWGERTEAVEDETPIAPHSHRCREHGHEWHCAAAPCGCPAVMSCQECVESDMVPLFLEQAVRPVKL